MACASCHSLLSKGFNAKGSGAGILGALSRRAKNNKSRSEEHTSELQSRFDLVCRLLLEKKKKAKGVAGGDRSVNGGNAGGSMEDTESIRGPRTLRGLSREKVQDAPSSTVG